jgi:hypothetical protein
MCFKRNDPYLRRLIMISSSKKVRKTLRGRRHQYSCDEISLSLVSRKVWEAYSVRDENKHLNTIVVAGILLRKCARTRDVSDCPCSHRPITNHRRESQNITVAPCAEPSLSFRSNICLTCRSVDGI